MCLFFSYSEHSEFNGFTMKYAFFSVCEQLFKHNFIYWYIALIDKTPKENFLVF